MLKITIQEVEGYDEKTNEFKIIIPKTELQLEHSLVSMAKWESKWHKPFLSKKEKTPEETLDYIKCMTLTQNVNEKVYNNMSSENIKKIEEYIKDPMTATTFSDSNNKGSSGIFTSELIYYQMIAYNIPFECQKWHLNRLITLIGVCSRKNAPEKKISRNELYSRNKALNEARKAKMHTRG